MLILKILLFIFGTVFSTFGYLIYFRKKYSLINSFNLDVLYKRRDASYAKKTRADRICSWFRFNNARYNFNNY